MQANYVSYPVINQTIDPNNPDITSAGGINLGYTNFYGGQLWSTINPTNTPLQALLIPNTGYVIQANLLNISGASPSYSSTTFDENGNPFYSRVFLASDSGVNLPEGFERVEFRDFISPDDESSQYPYSNYVIMDCYISSSYFVPIQFQNAEILYTVDVDGNAIPDPVLNPETSSTQNSISISIVNSLKGYNIGDLSTPLDAGDNNISPGAPIIYEWIENVNWGTEFLGNNCSQESVQVTQGSLNFWQDSDSTLYPVSLQFSDVSVLPNPMGYMEGYGIGDGSIYNVGPQDTDSPMQNYISWPNLNPDFIDMSSVTNLSIPKYTFSVDNNLSLNYANEGVFNEFWRYPYTTQAYYSYRCGEYNNGANLSNNGGTYSYNDGYNGGYAVSGPIHFLMSSNDGYSISRHNFSINPVNISSTYTNLSTTTAGSYGTGVNSSSQPGPYGFAHINNPNANYFNKFKKNVLICEDDVDTSGISEFHATTYRYAKVYKSTNLSNEAFSDCVVMITDVLKEPRFDFNIDVNDLNNFIIDSNEYPLPAPYEILGNEDILENYSAGIYDTYFGTQTVGSSPQHDFNGSSFINFGSTWFGDNCSDVGEQNINYTCPGGCFQMESIQGYMPSPNMTSANTSNWNGNHLLITIYGLNNYTPNGNEDLYIVLDGAAMEVLPGSTSSVQFDIEITNE